MSEVLQANAAWFGSTRIASRRRPYIYVAFSQTEHIVYVGQTIGKEGVIGRWVQHLSSRGNSSFQRRLADHDETAFSRLRDLTVFYWDLGDAARFQTVETTDREAVEYLTSVKLRRLGGLVQPYFRVISTVRPNRAIEDALIQDTAARITHEFRERYSKDRNVCLGD